MSDKPSRFSRGGPPDSRPWAATFTANHTSVCDVCGFDIDSGDECTWTDDQAVHLDCGEEDA